WAEALQLTDDAHRFSRGNLDALLRGPELVHSLSPIIVGGDRDDLKTHLRGKDPVDNAVLQPKPRRAVALPFTRERLVVESSDLPQALRSRESSNILPLLVAFQDLLRGRRALFVNATMLLDMPHAILCICYS